MTDFFKGSQGQALQQLAQTLWDHGYKVYLAGGCVRDIILGRPYHDLDVVTDASVEEIQGLFSKTIPVGVQFGIVRVLVRGFEFEVARFRRDGPYEDGRHPQYVQFASPEEDAARRDFTVNALFYDLKTGQILDFVHGLEDLSARRLRAVGDPSRRFREDYLRILRLLRFSCQLGFTMDASTALAAQALVPNLNQVSGERLQSEICKALAANPEKALQGFVLWKLPQTLFPGWGIEGSTLFHYYPSSVTPGSLLAQWLISFQTTIARRALQRISSQQFEVHPDYANVVRDMSERFRLSRTETRILKELGAVLAWPNLWPQLREGYRAALVRGEGFAQLLEVAEKMNVWPEEMLTEIKIWLDEPPQSAFLVGADVAFISPEQRGAVLRESLYLQYERVLLNRELALAWLNKNYRL